MKTSRNIQVVSCHAEGEVGDVIVGGVSVPPGETLWQQSRNLEAHSDLREFLLNEPRGGVFRHANLLVPPVNPKADCYWIPASVGLKAETPALQSSQANPIKVSSLKLSAMTIRILKCPPTES